MQWWNCVCGVLENISLPFLCLRTCRQKLTYIGCRAFLRNCYTSVSYVMLHRNLYRHRLICDENPNWYNVIYLRCTSLIVKKKYTSVTLTLAFGRQHKFLSFFIVCDFLLIYGYFFFIIAVQVFIVFLL